MYKLINFTRDKFAVFTVIGAMLFGAVLGGAVGAPGVSAQQDQDFGLNKINDTTQLGSKGLVQTVSEIINVALGLLGIVAVVIILIGGFKWMTAGGNDEKVQEARKVIFSGIIGLAIILSAWAITQFVISSLSSATGTGDASNFSG